MAFQLSDLQAIDAVIAAGTLSVQYADRRVQYNSMAELLQARALIANQIAASTGSQQTIRQYRVITDKGF